MPKLKTKSGAKKRFQVKKSGKVKHAKASPSTSPPSARPRSRSAATAAPATCRDMDAKKVIKEMFPYGAN